MFSNLFLLPVNNYLFTFIFTIVCLFLIYFLTYPRRLHTNLPPGPHPYPVIGNILDLKAVKGKTLETYFTECREKYGDVFCLRIFNTVVVVLNGYEVIKDAFVTNSHLFSERPAVPLFTEFKEQGLVTTNGEKWKRNRRFSIRTLRDFGMGKNILQVKIQEEIKEVLSELEKLNGKPFNMKSLLNWAISNIIVSVLCGKRYAYDDEEFREHLDKVQEVFKFQFLFFLPHFSKYIPADPFGSRKVIETIYDCMKFYERHIDEHIESYDENSTRDLIDAYIKETRAEYNQETRRSFNKKEIGSIVFDLFSAGSETTLTALNWGLVFLMRDRDLQTRLYNELKANVTDDRLPVLQDKTNLPQLEATTLEILRVGNINPLAVPHSVLQDCSFKGFDIPKGSHVFTNMYSVLADPKTWRNPELFQPSRFITKEGVVCPIKELIPFSIVVAKVFSPLGQSIPERRNEKEISGIKQYILKVGRENSRGPRSCAGEQLAKMELFLFFSALVQRFEFLPPDGEDVPTLEAELGITRKPKSFMMRAIKRQ